MTAYDHEKQATGGADSCYVYASDDVGATWKIASKLEGAFECNLAQLGGSGLYLNARHRSKPGQGHSAAGPFPRVQATDFSDDPGFGLRVNTSLAPLYDPDSGGVLGAVCRCEVSS